jgi:HK97 family phage prohead protease
LEDPGTRAAHGRRLQLRGKAERRFRTIGRGRTVEQRKLGAKVIELRGRKGSEVVVEGQVLIYSSSYQVFERDGSSFEERMLPGVATAVLADPALDCRLLVNHSEVGLTLARTKSGTLRLSDSPTALSLSATLDTRSSQARDVAYAVERGDLNQLSVGFVVGRDQWSADGQRRSVISFKELLDCSIVTFAANPATSVAVTSSSGMGGMVA